jgi:hypothetical protein
VSFVNLRERRPATGFIRADQAPDLKKYADLLEENARLRAELSKIEGGELKPFPGASDNITIAVRKFKDGTHDRIAHKEVTWGDLFVFICKQILNGDDTEREIEQSLITELLKQRNDPIQYYVIGIFENIKFKLIGRRLIDVTKSDDVEIIWKLTDFGQEQFGILMN